MGERWSLSMTIIPRSVSTAIWVSSNSIFPCSPCRHSQLVIILASAPLRKMLPPLLERDRLRINDPIAFPTAPSNAGEPVIALVLPVAAGILVGDLNRLQVLGALEAELGGKAKPQRCAPLRRQRLFLEIERQNSLRLQRAGHVDAGRITIEAFEIDVAGRKVGADAPQKRSQRHAAPLANLAPALDADMPGDLPLLRQCHQLLQRPVPPVGDKAADIECPVIRYGVHLPLRVI